MKRKPQRFDKPTVNLQTEEMVHFVDRFALFVKFIITNGN